MNEAIQTSNRYSPSGVGGKIILTGAAGFIGSCMLQFLNDNGFENIIIVDDFGVEEKRKNWEGKKFTDVIERQSLFEWLAKENPSVNCFIHIDRKSVV